MKKYIYFFVLLVCSVFLMACESKETSGNNIKKALLNSEETEIVIPDEESSDEQITDEGQEKPCDKKGCKKDKKAPKEDVEQPTDEGQEKPCEKKVIGKGKKHQRGNMQQECPKQEVEITSNEEENI